MTYHLILLLFSIAAASAAVVPHIVRGKPSEPNSKPWLLTIIKDVGRPTIRSSSECGASLIRLSPDQEWSDIALTAAHCIGLGTFPRQADQKCHNKPKLFKRCVVIAANHNFQGYEEGEIHVNVIDGQCHENWSPESFADDIALLKLEKPLNFSTTIQPIDLPQKGSQVEAGTVCNIAGWGAWKFGREGIHHTSYDSTVLQELDIKVLSEAECLKDDPLFDSKKRICEKAANGDGSACFGDSGGPVVCPGENGKPIQYGVISHGIGDCSIPGNVKINIDTNVPYYLDWIEQEMKALSGNAVQKQ